MRQLFVGGRRAAVVAAFTAVVTAGVAAPAATASVAPHTVSSVTLAASTTVKPHVTSAPKSVVVASGKKATFKVKASGLGLTYRWYVSTNGTRWAKVAKATHTSYTVKAKASLNGHRYRVVVKNGHGTVTSHSAKLIVAVKPHVTRQPHAASIVSGKKATFSIRATGNALGYQWYRAAPGKSFVKVTGATKPTYSFTTSASKNGYRYKAAVHNKAGHVMSSSARLAVITKPKITRQPAEEIDSRSGAAVTISVQATGFGLAYQWQYYDDSLTGDGEYHAIKGATRSSYTFRATTKTHDDYRVVVSNKAGKVASDDAFVLVDSSLQDPYGPDAGGMLSSWALGLDTELKGGATVVTGDAPTTVKSTFLAIPLDLHAEPGQLTIGLVVGGTTYAANVVAKQLPAGLGMFDLTATVSVPVDKESAEKGVWKVTDASGTAEVTQYFAQG